MKRKIIHIHADKCNGCGICANACHEGAIEMVDGKARLISDKYCDGLGDCLPGCPTGAIEIIEREADGYDDEAVKQLLAQKKQKAAHEHKIPCGCPGTMAKQLNREPQAPEARAAETVNSAKQASELRQWPVQLKLVNPEADYFDGADLLIAADCVAYAYGNFHQEFIKNRVTVIGCPKLDDVEYYRNKITEILAKNEINSITVVRMEVPCCGGIIKAVREAMLKAQTIVPYREVVIGLDGAII